MSANDAKMTTENICADFACEITVNNKILRVTSDDIILKTVTD
jgi:hypothetical protein